MEAGIESGVQKFSLRSPYSYKVLQRRESESWSSLPSTRLRVELEEALGSDCVLGCQSGFVAWDMDGTVSGHIFNKDFLV